MTQQPDPVDSSLGVIGVGELASAVVDGLRSAGATTPEIFLSPRNEGLARDLADRHDAVQVCADNQAVVNNARVILLTVRPDVVAEVLSEIAVPAGSLVISAVAGATHASLRNHLGEAVEIVRTIPLPAVRERSGITAIYPGHPEVEALFEPLGGTLVVPDVEALNAIQTSTASISTLLDCLSSVAGWLAEHGIEGPSAESFVRSMFQGVAGGLSDHSRSLSELVTAHETPGGLNEQVRRTWLTQRNREALTQALDGVRARLAGD